MSIEIYYDQGGNILYFRFVSSQYISISRKRTDLSMYFHLSVMQGIFDILHHFADLYCLRNRSIYLHHSKTHGFINAFSSLCDARYIRPPASLCRSIYFLRNRSIYLHHSKTHGFINPFSTPDYASYIQPPASYAPLRPSCERYALAFPVVAVHMLFPSIIWSSPRRPTVQLEGIID